MFKELYALASKGDIKHWTIEVVGDSIEVKYGKLGGKMQSKITKVKPKNVGRANETTPEEQALLEAQSKYNKQVDKCYRPTVELAKSVGQILPMLAHNYLNSGHRISFPCDVSPKLDGVRCVATVLQGKVTLDSRGGKTYDCPEGIKKELIALSTKTGITRFDGELYIHGMLLQDIVSAAKKYNTNTPKLKYYIFDIPVSDVPWSERKVMLTTLQDANKGSLIEIVRNVQVNNETAARIFLDTFINDGYEGMMLRNLRGVYEFNHRSANLQKWKLMDDAEAFVTGVEIDKNGEGVLICRMKGTTDKEFRCKMVGSHEERIFDKQKLLVGKWITYKYQALTADGLPQFPVGLRVRECDSEGNPIE